MNALTLSRLVRHRPALAYASAFFFGLVATLFRFLLGDLLAAFPFLLPVTAVTVSAFLTGLGPSLLTAVVAGMGAEYYFIDPASTLLPEDFAGWIGLTFYFVLCATISGLTQGMLEALESKQKTEDDLRALTVSLDRRVAERTDALQKEMQGREAAQAQLRQLQKMESIGQLTGGIAHDFNNMLAIIIGSLDLAKRKLDSDDKDRARQYIDNAAEGAQRAALLTARLLAFSRQQPLVPQTLDANKLVSGMSELLRRTIGEQIYVETVLAGGLWQAFADPSQLENAIVNLAVNARDAMPLGGKLTIETANSDLDDHYARTHHEVSAGQYVLISVTDSGCGMPPDVIERAFDPFYTTKGVGKGTGLGLSQVFGFVKQSGGHVKIYSEIGHGTAVKIYLPRHRNPVTLQEESGQELLALPQGRGDIVVLVVEDENQVRRFSVDALRDLGFTVIQAADGNQALALLASQPRVDLLFTDIVMPEMNGRMLADKAREHWPQIKILFTTGYTRNAVVHNGMLDPGVAFLPKPFTVKQLAVKMEDVLAGRGANRAF